MFSVMLAMMASGAMGQDGAMGAAEERVCPYVSVSSSSYERGKASFSLELGGLKAEPVPPPTFQWSISNGKIVAGQGTVLLLVEATPGGIVTATVDIAGYPDECEKSAIGNVVIAETDS